MQEGRRNLGTVLTAGSLLWILANIIEMTAGFDDAANATATAALALIAIGIWAVFAVERGFLALLGSGLAFIGGAWLAVVHFQAIASNTTFDKMIDSTLTTAALAILGIGLVICGVAVFIGRALNPWLGVPMAAMAILYLVVGLAKLSLQVQEVVAIVLALTLLAVGLVAMTPPRWSGWWLRRPSPAP